MLMLCVLFCFITFSLCCHIAMSVFPFSSISSLFVSVSLLFDSILLLFVEIDISKSPFRYFLLGFVTFCSRVTTFGFVSLLFVSVSITICQNWHISSSVSLLFVYICINQCPFHYLFSFSLLFGLCCHITMSVSIPFVPFRSF